MSVFSRYKNALKGEQNHTRTLKQIIFALIILCAGLGFGLYRVPSHLVIHNPPDLRSGSTRAWWEIDPSAVYSFSFYIFQQLNRWPLNGEIDYKRNISALGNYLTPSCQRFLERDYDMRKNQGELKERVRGVYEIPGRGYTTNKVVVNSQDDWYVNLDLATDEYYGGDQVKRTLVRYPLHIVRFDVDPETNPFGLALNCFTQTPQLIEVMPEHQTE